MRESLLEIKNAEEKAIAIVEKAKEELKKTIKEAEHNGEDIITKTKKKTENEVKKMRELYSKESAKEVEKILLGGEEQLKFLEKKFRASFSKGVEAALLRVIQ
ncbi:MAG: hypothetical protein ACXQTP_04720 [Candidatus Methanofastidiosia archaeon]